MEQPPNNSIQQNSPEKETGDSGERTLADYLHGQERGNIWELPTDTHVIDPAVDEFVNRLQAVKCNDDEIRVLSLNFREALINGMAHGNLGIKQIQEGQTLEELINEKLKSEPTNKKVLVTLEINTLKIKIAVHDQGNGFDWQHIPDPTKEENILKPYGRGIFLMRAGLAGIGCTVNFNKEGNEITIELDRKPGASPK